MDKYTRNLKQNPRGAQPVWLIVTRLVRSGKEMSQHVVPAGELSEKVVEGVERGGRKTCLK